MSRVVEGAAPQHLDRASGSRGKIGWCAPSAAIRKMPQMWKRIGL